MIKRKKIWIINLLFVITLCSCGNRESTLQDIDKQILETESATEDTEEIDETEVSRHSAELYQKFDYAIYENDRLRMESDFFSEDSWKNSNDKYREILKESLWGQVNEAAVRNSLGVQMEGILLADETIEGRVEMRIALCDEYGWMEYSYYNSGTVIYFSCYGTDRKDDMPEYQVCENVLEYIRADVYQDKELEAAEWLAEWERFVDESQTVKESVNEREYYGIDGKIYRIDREKKEMTDVTEDTQAYMAKWLEWEAQRVSYSRKVTPETERDVKQLIEELISEKHILKGSIAVCDLNQDGKEDYIAVIYNPDNVWEGPNYYIDREESMWMFQSDGKGGYCKKLLLEGNLSCSNLEFLSLGKLRCINYFSHNRQDSWKIEYFLYDKEMQEFYLEKSLETDFRTIFIKGRETIGTYTIGEYYTEGERSTENWVRNRNYDIKLEDGRNVYFRYESIYQNQDSVKTKSINQEIVKMENIFTEDILLDQEDNKDSIYIGNNVTFQNDNICSGRIYGLRYTTCFNIETETGICLDIKELVPKEKMLKICRKGMKDEYRNQVSAEEEKRLLHLIDIGYESSNSLTPVSNYYLSEEYANIAFQITAWGVYVYCAEGTNEYEKRKTTGVMLDKEYFIDTLLWNYMKPDF